MNKQIKVALLGLGIVGSGVANAIITKSEYIKKHLGVSIFIESVLVRDRSKSRNVVLSNNVYVDSIDDILDNPEIDVDIEVMGGETPALDYILQSIKKGKNVVTANKEVIAKHGPEIFATANSNGVRVLFESAVCAGTPIIKLLKEELAANRVSKISGMLNGTSNFILSNMEEGAEFDSTLELAQKEGYAEPDPTFDIEGMDAAHKIGILSALAFGTSLPPKDFYVEGITKIEKSDFTYAMDMGYTVKHLAVAKVDENLLELRAHPALIKLDSHLANLKGVRNGMEIDTDLIGKIHIAGSGAGQESTASGLISDLINLANSKAINDQLENNNITSYKVSEFSELVFQYYFYIEAEDKPGVMASITSLMASKQVGIESIVQKEELDENCVPIILITDPFKESDHSELHKELLTIESVKNIRSIRIESN